MRKKFSTKWKASKQPRKQRKYLVNAPYHIKRKFLAATLSKELRKKYGRRNIEIRKDDEVKVMRGKFKGKQGKIMNIDRKNTRINIEGIQRTKKEGTKVNIWFHPSKVKIVNLITDDIRRLKKSVKTEEKEGIKEEKPKKDETKKLNKTKKKSSPHSDLSKGKTSNASKKK